MWWVVLLFVVVVGGGGVRAAEDRVEMIEPVGCALGEPDWRHPRPLRSPRGRRVFRSWISSIWPSGTTHPTPASSFEPPCVNHMLPSGPLTMLAGALEPGNSLTSPAGFTRPIAYGAFGSVNHMLPSGPAAMLWGSIRFLQRDRTHELAFGVDDADRVRAGLGEPQGAVASGATFLAARPACVGAEIVLRRECVFLDFAGFCGVDAVDLARIVFDLGEPQVFVFRPHR